jgi:hypothetical protein
LSSETNTPVSDPVGRSTVDPAEPDPRHLISASVGAVLLVLAVATKVLAVAHGNLTIAQEILSTSNQWTIVLGSLLLMFPFLVTIASFASWFGLSSCLIAYTKDRVMTRRNWENLAIWGTVLILTVYLTTVLVYWLIGVILLCGTVAILHVFIYRLFPRLPVLPFLTWLRPHTARKRRPPSQPSIALLIPYCIFVIGMLCALLFSSTTWLPAQKVLLRNGPIHRPFTAYVLRADDIEVVLLIDTSRTVISIPLHDVITEQPCHLPSSLVLQGSSLWGLLTSNSGPKLPACPR